MTSADPKTGFSLTYELQPDDLLEIAAAAPRRKQQRARAIYNAVLGTLICAILTFVTVLLDLPSLVKNSSGAPSWMYAVDAVIWFLVAYSIVLAWRLSPRRLARRIWSSGCQLHGRYHDKVGADGMSCIAPDGTQASTPWANIDHIRETENAFHLIGRRGATLIALPKRGLPSPDLVSALREFLNCSVSGQPPAATPDSGVDRTELRG